MQSTVDIMEKVKKLSRAISRIGVRLGVEAVRTSIDCCDIFRHAVS